MNLRREIKCLPEQVINQIAAGEVVERPYSVVKELVENSIDAGSSHIAIEIDKGGTERISVMDNGGGMEPSQVALAMRRHATSKLRDVTDLFSISTFGFRGEALPSIASVSRFELSTKTQDADAASVFKFEGGKLAHQGMIGAPKGTRIVVSDLFYNVPARKKFLRSVSTEAAHVHRTVSQLAIANPNIHFTMLHNGRQVIAAPKQSSLRKRVETLWGKYLGQHYGYAEDRLAGISVRCFLGHPKQWLSTTKGIQFFVNQRPVKDKGMLSTLIAATKGVGNGEGYPTSVLFLDIPKETMDINVHPQKTEIRFSDTGRVLAALRHAVREALSTLPLPEPDERIKSHAAMPLNARRQFMREDLLKRHEVSWAKVRSPEGRKAFAFGKKESSAQGLARGYNAPPKAKVGTAAVAPATAASARTSAFSAKNSRWIGETSTSIFCLETEDTFHFVKRQVAEAIVIKRGLLTNDVCVSEQFLLGFEVKHNVLDRIFEKSELDVLSMVGFDVVVEEACYSLKSKPVGFSDDRIESLFVLMSKEKGALGDEDVCWLVATQHIDASKPMSTELLKSCFEAPGFVEELKAKKGLADLSFDFVDNLYGA